MIRILVVANLLLMATVVYSQTTETNPAFENIAPCGCDLTVEQYDNNCCCDPDSEPGDISISNCISGPFGGNFTILDDRLCTTVQSYTPDWFPFTCIQFLNSPDLGLYYYPSTTPSSSFTPSELSYDVTDDSVSTFSCGTMTYNASDPILATYNTTQGCSSSILGFPQSSLTGECLRQSRVRYLQETSASCDVSITTELCTAGSILDAAYYTTAEVRSMTTQVANVTYACSSITNDPLFVKTNTGITEVENENLFSGGSSTSTEPCISPPAAPVENNGVCENAVASVIYTFTWDSSTITAVNIAVTLVNVNFTTTTSVASGGPSNVLSQNFAVTFTPLNSANSVSYSGFPGYEFGLPVISANDIQATEVNRTAQLTVWEPGSSGLCADSSLVAPSFGMDSLSGCVITFGFQNCADLRTLVENQQMQLLQANRVSRFGNPSDAASSVDWITVLSNSENFTESENATEGVCEGIPSRAVLEFFWAKTGEQDGTAIREIVGARVGLTRETWNILCTQSQSSACSVSSYAIYSTVTFTEIPPQAPASQTSYEINRNDTCRKDATCWPELLLPIQPEFFYLYNTTTAYTLRSYNYAWALFVTFFSIAAAIVPAHWSTIGKYLKQALPI